MKKHIPNFITLLNLFCGFCAIVEAARRPSHTYAAIAFIGFALLFDFCDGLVARLLHVKSELGKQLDSLSDLVSFGVAPAFILFKAVIANNGLDFGDALFFLLGCAVFPCCGAVRLGKFNLDDRQTENFRGLPIPLAALTLVSFSFFDLPAAVTGGLLLALCVLMLVGIPLFSLKFKNMHWDENWYRYLIIIFSIILFVPLGMRSVPFITLIYFIISIFVRKKITA